MKQSYQPLNILQSEGLPPLFRAWKWSNVDPREKAMAKSAFLKPTNSKLAPQDKKIIATVILVYIYDLPKRFNWPWHGLLFKFQTHEHCFRWSIYLTCNGNNWYNTSINESNRHQIHGHSRTDNHDLYWFRKCNCRSTLNPFRASI